MIHFIAVRTGIFIMTKTIKGLTAYMIDPGPMNGQLLRFFVLYDRISNIFYARISLNIKV